MQRINAIMASTQKGVIGLNGGLPWNLPDEIKYFYDTIGDKTLVMGYKTFISLPDKIKNKKIVFSKDHNPEATIVRSMQDFKKLQIDDAYFIGGGELAKLFITEGMISTFLLTIIKKDYIGDVFLDLNIFHNGSIVRETSEYTILKYEYGNKSYKNT